jgi:aspartyl-tRNA(Asn)/glutamyl-tRNA(Gln) amidotransferase subunit A
MKFTAAAQAEALAKGEKTSEELASDAIARIRETNGEWHVFTSVSEAAALDEARRSDRRRRDGMHLGTLDGVPVAVKDNIDVAGMVTSGGTGHDFGGPAKKDAGVVARLRAAGAVILGKLNMHEGALGATTDNPVWGRCENPAVPGHTPGGSSGGSGAAVAGGLVAATLGTDTMGSVRIPAAYCGTWGLKPTKGLIGTSGLQYLSWHLDTIGPLANSADDLALMTNLMAGYDRDDPRSLHAPEGWSGQVVDGNSLKGVVIGYPDAAALTECEDAVLAAFELTLKRGQAAGATLRKVVVEGWNPGQARRHGLLVSEAEAGSLLAGDLERNPQGFSEGFRKLLDYGRSASAERLARAYWELDRVKLAFFQCMEGLDALLMPTAPQRAFPHGAAVPANQADFTALANFAGVPAVAFPVPASDGRAPASVQLVGMPFSEGKLLRIAKLLGKGE